MYNDSSQRPVSGACSRCKALKVKCEFKTDTEPCKRCLNGGHECIIPQRRTGRVPPKREHLLNQIREQASQIRELMTRLETGRPHPSHQGPSTSVASDSGSDAMSTPRDADFTAAEAVGDWIANTDLGDSRYDGAGRHRASHHFNVTTSEGGSTVEQRASVAGIGEDEQSNGQLEETEDAENPSPFPESPWGTSDSRDAARIGRGSARERIPKKLEAIAARLIITLRDVRRYRRLLGYRASDAQKILNLFEVLLNTPGLTAKFRRNLLVATQRLSRTAGLYPTCYNLQDIKVASRDPVAAGGFADIYKGHLLGQTVCLKVIRLYQTSNVHSFLKHFATEAILWGQLSHPNLLPFYGLYQYGGRPCLVSPWISHGDVNHFLAKYPDTDRNLLVADVASGIAYLHEHEIIHGDLKGANILVNDSKQACLADFGLAAVSDKSILHWTSHSSAASHGGSVRWQAPELFDIETDDVVHNSKSSDVYAFSCVVYEIFTGNIPFYELHRDPAVMAKVQSGARPSRPPELSPTWQAWGLTEPLWSLMTMCWDANPTARPTIQVILARYLSKRSSRDGAAIESTVMSPARFRDSVSAQSELRYIADVEAILDTMDAEMETPAETT